MCVLSFSQVLCTTLRTLRLLNNDCVIVNNIVIESGSLSQRYNIIGSAGRPDKHRPDRGGETAPVRPNWFGAGANALRLVIFFH